MEKWLFLAAVALVDMVVLSGCFTYKDCTFNVPVHASLLDLPFIKPVESVTPTPSATPAIKK
ncbi:MAG TPA: hypothetical protein VJ873_09400 [bacterium]|nr:hypothetical protein [bacterium]